MAIDDPVGIEMQYAKDEVERRVAAESRRAAIFDAISLAHS